MTRVLVAASIDNELGSKDIVALQRLKQTGCKVQFYYYLPKVPAQFSAIPSFNEVLEKWRAHALKILRELGNKLDIPPRDRHFVDEIIGPDQVFDEAKEANAQAILTSHKKLLKQSLLSKVQNRLSEWVTHRARVKEVPVLEVNTYVANTLGSLKERQAHIIANKAAINDEKISSQERASRR